MSTLTKSNAKERCRTCLRKLIKNELNTDHQLEDGLESSTTTAMRINYVLITSDMELLEMLEKHVGIEFVDEASQDEEYPQNVCIECCRQLHAFETFRNRALDSADKLYRVFHDGTEGVHKIELQDNGLECKDAIREQLKVGSDGGGENDIFNMLLKDSLMETEAILLEGAEAEHNINDMGPDPFQSESAVVKRRGRKPKPKEPSATKQAVSKIKRRTRANKTVETELTNFRDEETHVDTKPEPKDTVESSMDKEKFEGSDENDEGENSIDNEWPEMDSHINHDDENSTDNEALSKKIKHSKKLSKKSKLKEKSNESESDSDYLLETLKKSSKKYKKKNDGLSLRNEENEEDEKNHMKSDLETDELSSESELDEKTSKVKKKKPSTANARKRSSASGRKKGLTNSYKCEQCNRRFGHKITLDAHIRKIHEGQKKAYKCELCDKSYSFMGGLTTHMRETHERQEESYHCKIPDCDKKYTSYITLQRHIRVKHMMTEASTRYVCEQCGATFKQTSNLRYHMRTRHPTEEDLKHKEIIKERLECEICNKSFNNLYTLKYHKLRIHADDKKYECKICGRRVAKKFMLDQHMLVHSEDKTACKFCGREFVRKYQVEAHIKAVHQKLKPFQCSHCSESFASRKTLRHHIYIHTGEKPYVCDICGQSYRQPTCLKNHRKIHSKVNSSNNVGNSNNSTDATATANAAAAAAAAAMAVNRNFLNNLMQNTDDAMASSSAELGLH